MLLVGKKKNGLRELFHHTPHFDRSEVVSTDSDLLNYCSFKTSLKLQITQVFLKATVTSENEKGGV